MTLQSQPQTPKEVEADMNYCWVIVIKLIIIELDYWDLDKLLEDGAAKIHYSNVYRFNEFYLERRLKKIWLPWSI